MSHTGRRLVRLLAVALVATALAVPTADPSQAAVHRPGVDVRVAPRVVVDNAASYRYAVPAAVRDGDRMVVTFLLDDESQQVTAPSGWQVLTFRSSTAGHGETVLVTSLVRAAGQPASFVFPKTSSRGASTFPLAVSTAAYSGAGTAKLSAYGSKVGTGVTSAPLPSIAGSPDGLLLTFVGTRTTTAGSGTARATVDGVSGAVGADVASDQWLGAGTKRSYSDGPTPALGVRTTRAARMVSVEVLLTAQAPVGRVRIGTTATSLSPATAGTIVYTPPATVQPGDVMVAAFGLQTEKARLSSVPAGWYPVGTASSGAQDPASATSLVYAHVRAVGDPAGYTWVKGSPPAGGSGYGAVLVTTFAAQGVSLPQLRSYSIGTGATTSGSSVTPRAVVGRAGGLLVEVATSRTTTGGSPTPTSATMNLVGRAGDSTATTLAVFAKPITVEGPDKTARTVTATDGQARPVSAHTGVVVLVLRPRTSPASNLAWSSGIESDLTTDAELGEWRGRAVDVLSTYPDRRTWGDVTDPRPTLSQFSANPARLAIGLAMLPLDESSATLSACAGGAYDDKMRAYATNLVGSVYPGGNRGDSIVRLAWEFNTPTDDSGILGHSRSEPRGDNANWVGCWQRWYTQIKSVAPDAVIEWNANCDTSTEAIPADPATGDAAGDVTAVYPGDAYVDLIGVDYYNRYPAVNDDAEWDAFYDRADKENARTPRGIGAWLAFARSHHKLLSLPEWGIGYTDPPAENGTDDDGNSYWVGKMYQFFSANRSYLDDEIYFDLYNGFGCQFVLHPMPSGCVNFKAAETYRTSY